MVVSFIIAAALLIAGSTLLTHKLEEKEIPCFIMQEL